MAKSKRWRAMLVSFVVHAVVLTSVGWIASRALVQPEAIEQYVELDLSQQDDPLAESQDSSPAGKAAEVAPIATPHPAAPASSEVPSVVAATNSMSVLSAEVSTNVSESGGGGVGQSSGGSGQGSGSGGGNGVGSGSGSGGLGSGTGSGNGGSGRGAGGYTHPGILSQVTPTYPESARRQGVQGTVLLKIQILASGRPGFVSVYRSSGDDSLDDAAVEAVQQWRFIPAEDRSTGEAITCVTTLPVVFRLD
ncbi:protein TonB [Sporomusaceae bacterium BoRhaA]|uniref:energy transducer TonB n=1 Tax=Pelorhabdus rhamnosifermentans TaxID=2772457 RepID=UPI001C05F55B|nr:energy transducer TonB [Pelorhabdus rhamnosifermentans]MBU2700290.1 protein TonB [Pelorhabdus rhamnosifermentans]